MIILDTSAVRALASGHKTLNLLAGNMAKSPGKHLGTPVLTGPGLQARAPRRATAGSAARTLLGGGAAPRVFRAGGGPFCGCPRSWCAREPRSATHTAVRGRPVGRRVVGAVIADRVDIGARDEAEDFPHVPCGQGKAFEVFVCDRHQPSVRQLRRPLDVPVRDFLLRPSAGLGGASARGQRWLVPPATRAGFSPAGVGIGRAFTARCDNPRQRLGPVAARGASGHRPPEPGRRHHPGDPPGSRRSGAVPTPTTSTW